MSTRIESGPITSSEDDAAFLARIFVLIYLVGIIDREPPPKSLSALWSRGHDGLNWQLFLPLAKDILKNK